MTIRRNVQSKSQGWVTPFAWSERDLETIARACPKVPAADLAHLQRDLARIVTTWRFFLAEWRGKPKARARTRSRQAVRIETAARRLQAEIDSLPESDIDVLDDLCIIAAQETIPTPRSLREMASHLRALRDAVVEWTPANPEGRPHKDHVSEIVRLIAVAYENCTGRKPTHARAGRFHRVVALCLVALGECKPDADLSEVITDALKS